MLLSASENITMLQNAALLRNSRFQHQERELLRASRDAHKRRTVHRPASSQPTAARPGEVLTDRKFRKYPIFKRRALMQADPLFNNLAASGHDPELLELADTMIESAIGFMPVPPRHCTGMPD